MLRDLLVVLWLLLVGECCSFLASGSDPTEDIARQQGGRMRKVDSSDVP